MSNAGTAEEGAPRLAVIVGPTGVGKTGVAMEVAERIGAEIVGADSVQVYRGMDIGTGKVTAEERARVPHHLIDVADPDDDLHARAYQRLADAAIADVLARGRRVLVVGGTGLYVRVLLHGVFPAPEPDPEVRARYERQAEAEGLPALHDRLKLVDPALAARVHPRDKVRVIRALEVYDLTGVPLSQHQEEHAFSSARYRALVLGLRREREALYRRIDGRVDAMLAQGFEAEVQALLDRGYGRDLKAMGAIGYAHLAAALAGETTREEAVHRLKRDTRRYAKRQLTWFTREPGLSWVDAPFDPDALSDRILEFVES